MSTTNKTLRDSGTEHELAFWANFVHSKQFATWLEPGKTPELDDYVYDLITAHGVNDFTTGWSCDVLDVGSGVASILIGTVPKERLYACDPLGAKYAKIFDYDAHGINAPDSFPAESLPYPDNRFEIVHMRNAIDHCEDPIKVLDELFRVCKPGGYVIVQGFEDEAIHENWQGFHQWNMAVTYEDQLYFVGKDNTVHVVEGNPDYIDVKELQNGRNWVVWICQK